MARVNVYLPDDLAAQARAAEVNISRITQGAIRAALAAVDTDRWIDHLARAPIVRHQLAGLLLGTWAAREQWRLADTLDAELSNVLPAVLVTTDGRLVAFSTVLVAFLRAHLPIALAGELRAENTLTGVYGVLRLHPLG